MEYTVTKKKMEKNLNLGEVLILVLVEYTVTNNNQKNQKKWKS